MKLKITYTDGTVIVLESVMSVTRVFNGVEIKCFGNSPVLHKNIMAIDVLDWL